MVSLKYLLLILVSVCCLNAQTYFYITSGFPSFDDEDSTGTRFWVTSGLMDSGGIALRLDSITPDTAYYGDTADFWGSFPGITVVDTIMVDTFKCVVVSATTSRIRFIVKTGIPVGIYDTLSVCSPTDCDTLTDSIYIAGVRPDPIIDTFICHVKRDSIHGEYCRNGDTLTAKGHNFTTIDTFFQNSTKTVWFTVVQQWNDSALVIPSTGSPRGYYSPIINRTDGVNSARKIRGIYVLKPGGL